MISEKIPHPSGAKAGGRKGDFYCGFRGLSFLRRYMTAQTITGRPGKESIGQRSRIAVRQCGFSR